eukprot:TRINITY_DN22037_c0_g1_i1.p1 TRINITY_DN22037_c0_g1~~TRINITY_DN22037_c0_g1_i1.p1  ORF type:complete len:741 (+),score=128.12 TRINITY_DN22037_c0_g1_i1:44-2224(+)
MAFVRASCGIVCIIASVQNASAWPSNVESDCGYPGTQEATSFRGALTLQFPSLCYSYACRSALASAQLSPSATFAFKADLLDCALPTDAGEHTLLNFSVTGLTLGDEGMWGQWLSSALQSLGADTSGMKSTWFPVGTAVRFYASIKGRASATPLVLTNALQAASKQPQLVVSAAQASPVSFEESSGEEASTELQKWHFLVAALSIYGILAFIAYVGPPVMRPLFLCWSEVCVGGGCLLYRPLCCPFVLTYQFIRIYIWNFFEVALARCFLTPRTKGCCWVEYSDKEFPCNDRSIGKVQGDTASGVNYEGGVAWAKASDIARAATQKAVPSPAGQKSMESGARLFQGRIEPDDVLQGSLGDCWLMAACATLSERPEVLQQAFSTKHYDPRGKYCFRLWNQIKDKPGTKWVDIVIDEYIPVYPGTLKPKFAKTHCNEMWVLLLEKAFAKMYGSYSELDGGHAHWAIAAITGNPCITLLREAKVPGQEWTAFHDGGDGCIYSSGENFDDDVMFKLLYKVRRQGAFVNCSGIKPQETYQGGPLATPLGGLIDGHAYSVLRFEQVPSSNMSTSVFRMVQIRNPHGQGEWQGTWGDKSTAWNDYPTVQQYLYGNAPRINDGTFWMQWEDFIDFWKSVEIVDCGTSIRSLAPAPYDSQTAKGTCLGCLKSALEYWICCLGMQRLYFGRTHAKDLGDLKRDMDKRCGFDQTGFFCDLCERSPIEASEKAQLLPN